VASPKESISCRTLLHAQRDVSIIVNVKQSACVRVPMGVLQPCSALCGLHVRFPAQSSGQRGLSGRSRCCGWRCTCWSIPTRQRCSPMLQLLCSCSWVRDLAMFGISLAKTKVVVALVGLTAGLLARPGTATGLPVEHVEQR
jgi:hypothetical protein